MVREAGGWLDYDAYVIFKPPPPAEMNSIKTTSKVTAT